MTKENTAAAKDPVTRSISQALHTALRHNASPEVAEPLAVALAASRSEPSENGAGPPGATKVDWSEDATPSRRLDAGTLARVLDHMRTRLDQPLTLEELARAANLSKYHFLRLFSATVGTTPHRYLTALRMAHGAQLLLSTRLTVAGVAERCGYAAPSRFSAAFREQYGTTPGRFRDEGGVAVVP